MGVCLEQLEETSGVHENILYPHRNPKEETGPILPPLSGGSRLSASARDPPYRAKRFQKERTT